MGVAWVRWFFWLVPAFFACPQRARDVEVAATDAGSASDASMPVQVKALELSLSTSADGGSKPLRLEPAAVLDLDPTDVLKVKSNLILRNYRVRIFDEADRALVSNDQVTESEEGSVYLIQLIAPLKAGHRYALVIDAETGSNFWDTSGKPHLVIRTELRVSGVRERSPPRKAKPLRKRRR